MYTFEQLKEDVRKEAEALRVHATKEERERINFNELSPESYRRCIYGLATSNCFSERAAELIHKCCCKYFRAEALPDIGDNHTTIERIEDALAGESVTNFVKNRSGAACTSYFSAIEAYICLPEAQNANLISYLRGETETLTL